MKKPSLEFTSRELCAIQTLCEAEVVSHAYREQHDPESDLDIELVATVMRKADSMFWPTYNYEGYDRRPGQFFYAAECKTCYAVRSDVDKCRACQGIDFLFIRVSTEDHAALRIMEAKLDSDPEFCEDFHYSRIDPEICEESISGNHELDSRIEQAILARSAELDLETEQAIIQAAIGHVCTMSHHSIIHRTCPDCGKFESDYYCAVCYRCPLHAGK